VRNPERGEIPSGEFAGTLAVGMPQARMRTKSVDTQYCSHAK
jgi:hypothetical protein